MTRYFIIPEGMPPYTHVSIEVTREQFDSFCEELYLMDFAEISTEFEFQIDTLVEKWFISYMDKGNQSIARCFGYTTGTRASDL